MSTTNAKVVTVIQWDARLRWRVCRLVDVSGLSLEDRIALMKKLSATEVTEDTVDRMIDDGTVLDLRFE